MLPNTLADVFCAVSRFLPDQLTNSASWKSCLALAEQLPVLLSPHSFGFEMHLHRLLNAVDLACCITHPGCDMLAGVYPVKFSSNYLANPAIWPHVKAFCKAWADPSSGLSRCITNLWLEFFLQLQEAPLYPLPFIKLKRDTAWKFRLPDILELLYGKRIPPPVKDNLLAVIQCLPSPVRAFQAAIYNREGACFIRLCLEGIQVNALADCVQTIHPGIPYPFEEHMDLLSCMERICVHIDIGRSTGTTVGIELRQAPDKELCLDTQPEWDNLLDLLTEKKFCLPENSRFLKGFPGNSYEMIHPDLTQCIVYRFLYYLKVIFTPEEPVTVKAYFGFVNRTRVPSLKEYNKPSFLLHSQWSPRIAERALQRGTAFLVQSQLPHGEFNTYLARDNQLETAVYDSSPFVTAFVLSCTHHLPDELFDLPRIKAKLFLIREGYPDYLWRYWTPGSQKTIAWDLDDTCCISYILHRLFHLSEVKKNIPRILSNRDEKGLFKTWIKEGASLNDVDIAVNANAVLYLGEREETKPALEFIMRCIKKGEENAYNWYYPDTLACYYMIARAAYYSCGSLKELFPLMTERIWRQRDETGQWRNELSAALALCALQFMGVEDERIDAANLRLINRQQPNGSWKRSAFYAGPEPPASHSVWFGSEELTTAFCLAALDCPRGGY